MKHGIWIPAFGRCRAWGGVAGLALSALLGCPASAQELDQGLLWSSPPAPGESWNPNSISIGNYGTQVFSQLWSFDTYSKLFSAHGAGTPQAIWTRTDPAYSTTSSADSAAFEDLHVGMHQYFLSGTSGPQAARITAYRSGTSSPEWQYTMPVSISNHTISGVWISRDATKVVAYAQDSGVNQIEVAVFEPLEPGFTQNPQPKHYSSLPGGATLRDADLSPDGSTLVLSYSAYTKVYDTETGTLIATVTVPVGTTITDGVAVSDNGAYLARGIVQGFQLYRRVGSTNYVLDHQQIIPSLGVCTALDLSDDSSTLVAGYALLPGSTIQVQAMSIATHVVTADRTFVGSGSLDNKVSDIAVSADGRYFVAGCWGDEAGLVPELVCFRSASSTPLATYHQPGSVVDVDIAHDGRRCVAGVRAFHVNIGGSNGRIECYNLVDRDMGLEGVPTYGSAVEFQWTTPANAGFALLLRARSFAPAPTTLPGVSGTLYLPRGGITFLPGTIGPEGIATHSYFVSGVQNVIGESFYFQGFGGNPRTLTEDTIKLTVLP